MRRSLAGQFVWPLGWAAKYSLMGAFAVTLGAVLAYGYVSRAIATLRLNRLRKLPRYVGFCLRPSTRPTTNDALTISRAWRNELICLRTA